MLKGFLTKEWFEAFIRLSRSTRNYYVSPNELKTIKIPTLLIGAEHDIIAPIKEMMTIYENVSGCEFVTIPQAGHGAFLEKAKEFATIVMGFISKYSG
jgi:pimeloyl-ACP methyl ester carboxylesterase